ncbi:GNAT family N-acetyltransferase [Jiangella muralis]|uniref:GNAT family N-acetyltransferase n=1 Tax=Jiangella muralis TaxID=702383 RepID=UPI00069EA372|nr:GNAT family N-acetyltransferase [Jiangella muralis]
MSAADEISTRAGVLTARPVAALTSEQAAEAMTRAFEGYVVPVSVDGPGFERRFGAEHLDRYLSEVYTADGDLVGICLITRRGTTARIGGFGCTPAYRGVGVGRTLMERAIVRCVEAGATRITLEVITSNAAAVRLYERLGFRILRTLVGYRWERPAAAGPVPPSVPSPIDPARFARDVAAGLEHADEPPWQLAPETLAAAVPPRQAYALGPAAALLSLTGTTAVLSAVHTAPGARRRGHGRALLAGLRDAFPGRRWTVPPLVPESDGAEFFRATGWVREELAQYEMVHGNV